MSFMDEYLKAKQEYEEYTNNEVDKPYKEYMTNYLKDNIETHARKMASEGCLRLFLGMIFGNINLGEGNNCIVSGIKPQRICVPCKNYEPDIIYNLVKIRRMIVCQNVCTEHFKGFKITSNVSEGYIYVTKE